MSTETKMAVDSTTGKKYPIELPASEVVKQEILKLDYPFHGITIKEATEKLAEKFGLSDEERKAQTKRGKRYLGLFHYEVVGPGFKKLLNEGKLEQPEGSGKPYILSGKIPPPSPPDRDIEEIYQQIREKVAEDLLRQIKANLPAFFENLISSLARYLHHPLLIEILKRFINRLEKK
jgi:restriction endonuclease Mrr